MKKGVWSGAHILPLLSLSLLSLSLSLLLLLLLNLIMAELWRWGWRLRLSSPNNFFRAWPTCKRLSLPSHAGRGVLAGNAFHHVMDMIIYLYIYGRLIVYIYLYIYISIWKTDYPRQALLQLLNKGLFIRFISSLDPQALYMSRRGIKRCTICRCLGPRCSAQSYGRGNARKERRMGDCGHICVCVCMSVLEKVLQVFTFYYYYYYYSGERGELSDCPRIVMTERP